nr:hypothetical protein [uncultured Cardiobacterium sp.]
MRTPVLKKHFHDGLIPQGQAGWRQNSFLLCRGANLFHLEKRDIAWQAVLYRFAV